MVEAAKIAYRDFPTVVNTVDESGITYDKSMKSYAIMDSKMQRAQRAIGGSSDSAQLAQSYLWSKLAHHKDLTDPETKELYNNVVILACIAQIAIDNVKKEFAVDPVAEIERIRSLPCMDRFIERKIIDSEDGKERIVRIRKDYPLFMKYTHEIPVTQNGIERPYEEIKADRDKVNKRIDKTIVCPMNWLEQSLDKIQGASRDDAVETHEYLAEKPPGKPKATQMSKIRTIVEEFNAFTVNFMIAYDSNTDFTPMLEKMEEVLAEISGMKFSTATIYRLIETSLGIEGRTNTDEIYRDATKYTRKMMNLLYRTNRDTFLKCFKLH